MLSTLLALAAFGAVMPEPTPADIAWVARGEFCEPETALPLPDDTLLVSNVCVSREHENGFLTLLDRDGEVIDWRIVDDLDAPLGMALVDEQLYVVDNNRVKVFHWPDYRLLKTIELDASVANDIAVAPDGTMYVTDMARNQVIRHTSDGSQSIFGDELQFHRANGIHIDGGNLYVGGERLWRVNLDTGVVTTIGPEWITDIDGIEIEADGTLQITPAAGPLIRYRSDDDFEVLGGDSVSSANHGYAASLKLALIPTGYDNTVIAIRIEDF